MIKVEHNVPGLVSVILVYGIIFTEYYLFIFQFLPTYQQEAQIILYHQYRGWATIIGIEFTLLYIMIHFAYFQVQHTSPGHPPKDLAKHYHEQTLEEIKQRTKNHSELLTKQRKKKMMKKFELAEEDDEIFDIIQSIQLVSYCFKCQNIKLPRTHHCKECNKCVLRMDHHCPWVNNCIGIKNHRFFCQFLLYAILCMSQCTYFIAADYFLHQSVVLNKLTANERFLSGICAATCFSLIVAMGTLLGFHLFHISQNVTTVEFHIEEMKTDNPFKKPKLIDNVKEVFGYEFKYWILPIKEPYKNELPRSDLFEV